MNRKTAIALQQAVDLVEQGRPQESTEILRSILVVDPQNRQAKVLLEKLEEAISASNEDRTIRKQVRRKPQAFEQDNLRLGASGSKPIETEVEKPELDVILDIVKKAVSKANFEPFESIESDKLLSECGTETDADWDYLPIEIMDVFHKARNTRYKKGYWSVSDLFLQRYNDLLNNDYPFTIRSLAELIHKTLEFIRH